MNTTLTPSKKLLNKIYQILPQTQCQSCGYKDCLAYAQAISESKENINRCAPGGEQVIQDLAQITTYPAVPLDVNIRPSDLESTALIDEQFCIGCTLCIDACPIDSIVGAAKRVHSILNSLCSGCGLCLPPCPTNCIEIVPLNLSLATNKPSSLELINLNQTKRSALWREKYENKQLRKEKESAELKQKKTTADADLTLIKNNATRITTAMEIARTRLAQISNS